jgi:3-oxoacyl-[acyl-carrier-protein] synthase II
MTMNRRRVVVTGLGCVSPVGNTVAESWASLLAGRSGIDLITRFDASAFACRIAGEVRGLDISPHISAKEARTMDTFIHYGIVAAAEAVQDAGLATGEALDEEAGRAHRLRDRLRHRRPAADRGDAAEYAARGPRRISPFFVPASIVNMVAGHVSMKFGFKGPNLAIATACTTGLHCIGEAGRLIEYGDADVVVAGGAESTVSPLGVGGFAAMRALSTRNDDPKTASRPWDKDRDGFVLGEGAGVLVLEAYEHAKARGARIYAELAGFGMSADAGHMTAPNMDGPRRAMVASSAQRRPERRPGGLRQRPRHLDAAGRHQRIQRHQGGAGRCRAARGGQLHQVDDRPPAGRRRRHRKRVQRAGPAPPEGAAHHQHLVNQDPECDLDYCANTARDMKIDVALKNNFGFGGTNGSLVFKRV